MKKNLQPLTPAALYARVSSERQDVDLRINQRVVRKYIRTCPRARGILNCGGTVLFDPSSTPEDGRGAGRRGGTGTLTPAIHHPLDPCPPGFFRRLPGRARNGVTGSGGGCVQDVGGRCVAGGASARTDARSPRGRCTALGTPSPLESARSICAASGTPSVSVSGRFVRAAFSNSVTVGIGVDIVRYAVAIGVPHRLVASEPSRVPPAVRALAWPGTPGRRRRPAGGGPW